MSPEVRLFASAEPTVCGFLSPFFPFFPFFPVPLPTPASPSGAAAAAPLASAAAFTAACVMKWSVGDWLAVR